MSKRDLKKYLNTLAKEQLEEQILDLYDKFKEVKTFYNFVFQPREKKLLEDAKFKIGKEYFPVNSRKPKARRSVAQKIIKHFVQLGVESTVVAEVMLFNLEVAQQFAGEKEKMPEAFYKSMFNSFQEACAFVADRGITHNFKERLAYVVQEAEVQHWPNVIAFENLFDELK